MAKTLFDKIWDSHVITDLGNGFVLLHIDRLLLHDLSGARALQEAVEKGYAPAQPRLVYGTPDHLTSIERQAADNGWVHRRSGPAVALLSAETLDGQAPEGVRRPANLEDAFVALTGKTIE